jgi:hypothetical protein
MPWPLSQDYNEAIQNPATCFTDPELKQGEAFCNALGLPQPCSGNFADVYAVQSGTKKWAVKCFTRQIPGLQERYAQISAYLQQVQLPFMVDFRFLEKGIQVRGSWYPVLKMQWVEGFALNAFVKDNVDKPQVLQTLCNIWLKLAAKLREANLAHCDLQHGNVLLVPGSKAGSVGVKLVDYDGMCVPALELLKSIELGHANYQHPQRLREGSYGLQIDRFPHLVIYTAIKALSVAGRPLWDRFDNGDNLLFTQKDFAAPDQSPLFQELRKLNDPEMRKLTQALLQAAQMPISQVPLLEELVEGKPVTNVRPATPVASSANVFAAATSDTVTPGYQRRKKSHTGVMVALCLGLALLIGGAAMFASMNNVTTRKSEAVAEVHKTQPSQAVFSSVTAASRTTFRERMLDTKPRTQPEPKSEPKNEPKSETKTEPPPEPKKEPEPPTPVGEIRSFAGNPGGENRVLFSPDGQRLISGGSDGRIRVWDVRSGSELLQLKVGESNIGAMVLTRDPEFLLTGENDGSIRLVNLTEKEVRLVGRHTDWVRDLALAADGKFLLSASGGPGTDYSIRLWDIAAGKELASIGKHAKPVDTIAPLPDGRAVLAGYDGGAIVLWDLKSGKELRRFSGHRSHVAKIVVSSDGQWAVSGSTDRTIRLWDIASGKELHRFTPGDVTFVALSQDEKRLLSVCRDKTVSLWDIAGRREIHRFSGHTGIAWTVSFAPDGRTAASASSDGTLRLWGLPDTAQTAKAKPKSGLKTEDKLLPGDSLVSQNGLYEFVLQLDGNLVLYKLQPKRTSLWQSNTQGRDAAHVVMQLDGNFVMRDKQSKSIWGSLSSYGHNNASLEVQDDGNVVITNTQGKVVWSTNTKQ